MRWFELWETSPLDFAESRFVGTSEAQEGLNVAVRLQRPVVRFLRISLARRLAEKSRHQRALLEAGGSDEVPA